MTRLILSTAALLALSACAGGPLGGLFGDGAGNKADAPAAEAPDADTMRPAARPASPPATPIGTGGAQTAASLDTTSAEEAAAATSAAGGADLGVTIASLGAPAEPGLWLKTPLVTAPGTGRVEYQGQSVQVDLIPLDGPQTGGSRMSLGAMRLLGAPLTGLPEVRVFRL